MKYLLIFIFSLSLNYSFGCSCATPDTKEGIARMISNADIVVEGTPYSIINQNNSSRENSKKEGTNILFSVTSVIKGNLYPKIIAINQWEEGNCAELYKIGNHYLIFGYEVKGFRSKKKSNINLPPPPGGEIDKNAILTTFSYDIKEVVYWEKLLKRYRVFTANSCSTFHPNSETAKKIKRQQLSTTPKNY